MDRRTVASFFINNSIINLYPSLRDFWCPIIWRVFPRWSLTLSQWTLWLIRGAFWLTGCSRNFQTIPKSRRQIIRCCSCSCWSLYDLYVGYLHLIKKKIGSKIVWGCFHYETSELLWSGFSWVKKVLIALTHSTPYDISLKWKKKIENNETHKNILVHILII